MTGVTGEEELFEARLHLALQGIVADADPEVVAKLKPGLNMRPDPDGFGFEVVGIDQDDAEVVLGRLTPDMLQPVWIQAAPKDPANPPNRNRLIELTMEGVLAFDEPVRERWIAALNAGQVEWGSMFPSGETFSKDAQGEYVPDPKGDYKKVPDVKAWLVDGIEPPSSIRIPSEMLAKNVDIEVVEPPMGDVIPLRPDDDA